MADSDSEFMLVEKEDGESVATDAEQDKELEDAADELVGETAENSAQVAPEDAGAVGTASEEDQAGQEQQATGLEQQGENDQSGDSAVEQQQGTVDEEHELQQQEQQEQQQQQQQQKQEQQQASDAEENSQEFASNDGASSASHFPGHSAFFSQDADDDQESCDWDSISRFVEAQLPNIASAGQILHTMQLLDNLGSEEGRKVVMDEIGKLGGTLQKFVERNGPGAGAGAESASGGMADQAEPKDSPASASAESSESGPTQEVLDQLFRVFQERHVVQAVQDFLFQPVVTDLVVDVCKAGLERKGRLLETSLQHFGEVLSALATLVKNAPELVSVIPLCIKLFAKQPCTQQAPVEQDKCPPAAHAHSPVAAQTEVGHIHRHVLCDGCVTREAKQASLEQGNRSTSGYIRGIRWKSAIHDDFDLCSTCEASGLYEEKYAPFLKIKTAKKTPRDIIVILRDSALARAAETPPRRMAPTREAPTRGSCSGGINSNWRRKCSSSRSTVVPAPHANLGGVRENKKESNQVVCPQGHSLRQFFTPHAQFSCDSCDSSIPAASILHGCRTCDFDLCVNCLTAQQSRSRNEQQQQQQQQQVPQPAPAVVAATVEPRPAVAAPTIERPRAKFLSEGSLPDGSIVAPNTSLNKIWRLSNPGSTKWPQGVRLVHVGGHIMGAPNGTSVPALEPNTELDISLPITSPPQPGRYISYWRLMTGGNDPIRFGHRLWIDITCAEPTVSPSPSENSLPRSHDASLKFPAEQQLLKEMGFQNESQNTQLLEQNSGDLSKVLQHLLANKP
jgi:hypothetical protein